MKILFSNIGYAKGIDGSLQAHVRNFHRHIYSGLPAQRRVLGELKELIIGQEPDVCCFVEVDSGSFHSAKLNHIQELIDEQYIYYDIANKYGEDNPLAQMPLHRGKSNGFIARNPLDFQKLYFQSGSKRLIYHLKLENEVNLLFAHFSLSRKTRLRQFAELQVLIDSLGGQTMILADFNIFQGFGELKHLLDNSGLQIMNDENLHTFSFHRRRMTLDLCLSSPDLASRINLDIIPQPFSDHAALLVDLAD